MKKHWTQTPEGRKKMAMIASRKRKSRYNSELGHNPSKDAKETNLETQIAYAFGHVESWLQVFASNSGYPASSIAYRVGELLLRTSRRKMVGT
jgi:hypothetical protein